MLSGRREERERERERVRTEQLSVEKGQKRKMIDAMVREGNNDCDEYCNRRRRLSQSADHAGRSREGH